MSYSYSYKKEIVCCKCTKELTPAQMQSCCTLIFAAVDIAAIILGFQSFNECSNEIYKPSMACILFPNNTNSKTIEFKTIKHKHHMLLICCL